MLKAVLDGSRKLTKETRTRMIQVGPASIQSTAPGKASHQKTSTTPRVAL